MYRLPIEQYQSVKDQLLQLPINTLFAQTVVDGHVNGKIYVDNIQLPSTFLIYHPYGMSLLFGNQNNPDFNDAFVKYALNLDNSRIKTEWLQTCPTIWNEKLSDLFGNNLIKEEAVGEADKNKIELSTRVNFTFNEEKYNDFKRNQIETSYEIVRTEKNHFEAMKGTVVPRYFWNTADDFCQRGVGFSLIYEGKVVSTAFSAFIVGDKLELGIESAGEYRGKGFATQTCMALIDYCLQNNFRPVWACRRQNINSMLLSQKLGFEPSMSLPFYKLVYEN